jgi:hypothetical protein
MGVIVLNLGFLSLYHSAINLTVAMKDGDRLEKCHVVVLHLKVATTICGCEA